MTVFGPASRPSSSPRGRATSPRNVRDAGCSDEIATLRRSLLQAEARIANLTEALQVAGAGAQRALDLERNVSALHHRCEGLEAELRVSRYKEDELRGAVYGRDAAWAKHESIEQAMEGMARRGRDAEVESALSLETARNELAAAQEATAAAQAEAAEEREAAKRSKAELDRAFERIRALDARVLGQMEALDNAERRTAELEAKGRQWRRERTKLHQDVDKNTQNSMLRREELYFTRTTMLKEQMRLRGELERAPLPPATGMSTMPSPKPMPPYVMPTSHEAVAWQENNAAETPHDTPSNAGQYAFSPRPRSPPKHREAALSPRQKNAVLWASSPVSPTRKPKPPPATFVHGLSPRSPRSLDDGKAFKEQLLLEYRAATQAAQAIAGGAGDARGGEHAKREAVMAWMSMS